MNFEILKTNIVCVTADAIVLPANTALKEGSGVSTAIFQAAGRRQLTKACEKIGSCEVGSAVPTLAYELDAKYIIHAVVPRCFVRRKQSSEDYPGDLWKPYCSNR